MDPNPKKKFPDVTSKITYIGVGIKPKNEVCIEGSDPTYFTLQTKDEMIGLRSVSANTIVYISDINETFVFSVSRKLWMLIDTN